MGSKSDPRDRISYLLDEAIEEEKEHPNNEEIKVRIETLQEVLEILDASHQ